MSNLENSSIERLMWIGEQSLKTATHYSTLRSQITALNITAMGVVLGLWSTKTTLPIQDNTVFYLLIFWAVIFAILSLKFSSGHAFSWGVYEKCRDAIRPDQKEFNAEYSKVESDYKRLFTDNCWCPVVWVTNSKHYLFWPVINFCIPAIPAIYICVKIGVN